MRNLEHTNTPAVEWVLALRGTPRGPTFEEQAAPCTAHAGENPLSKQPHACKIKPQHACSRVPPAASPAAAAAATHSPASQTPAKPPCSWSAQQEAGLQARLSNQVCVAGSPPTRGREQTKLQKSTVHHTGPCLCRHTHGRGVHQIGLCVQCSLSTTTTTTTVAAPGRLRACACACL